MASVTMANRIRQMLMSYSGEVDVEYREDGEELHVFIYTGLTPEDILQGEENVQGIDERKLKNILADLEGARRQIIISLLGDFQKISFEPHALIFTGEDTHLVLDTTHVHFFEQKIHYDAAVRAHTAQDL